MKNLLSSQEHYDFGMRKIKSIVKAASNINRHIQKEDKEE